MKKYKVIYTDYNYQDKNVERKIFSDAGIDVDFADRSLSRNELMEFCKDADGLVTTYTEIDKEFIKKIPNCKILVRTGIGFNTIDVNEASKRGIMVANVRDYCIDEVSDHAFAMMLALIRKLPKLNVCVKEKKSWTVNDCRPIRRISTLNVCCYGLGAIGKEFARKAIAFGMKVYVYDPFVSDKVLETLGATRCNSLKELAECADIFSIHTPLNDSTKGSVNSEILNSLKQTAYLLNVSRGAIVDEKALTEAICTDKIAGAGLDVLTSEHPNLDSPLVQHENTIITPHIAYYSEEADKKLEETAALQAVLALTEGRPQYFVNEKQINK
nr:C-terminal binding protein [uncultured Blautia sp.]